MADFAATPGDDLRRFVEEFVSFPTHGGNEAPAQDWFQSKLDAWGFETYRWEADPARLAAHPSFPGAPEKIPAAGRPSVGGVLELGTGEGPTLVLNGHCDVVPANEGDWTGDPFEPRWEGDRLTARGAADMKSGLAACVFAARSLAAAGDLNGRVVVESVAGEEEGGLGAAAAALDNPYPFERDAALVAEPTELRPVVASQGSVMMRLELEGRSAHAATRWGGVDVLDRFERIRRAFRDLETERCERVTHPLYEDFPVAWPVVCGTVRAGEWASTVPASLVAEWRLGVAPGETVAGVEAEFRDALAAVVAEDEWLREHPPVFERFSVQFEASEISPEEPIVAAVDEAMSAHGLSGAPEGVTYGADARHYIEAGIPTVLFGPGSIEQAHFPDETIDFREVETAAEVIADAARAYLSK
jgi:acetylornithine deacetylase